MADDNASRRNILVVIAAVMLSAMYKFTGGGLFQGGNESHVDDQDERSTTPQTGIIDRPVASTDRIALYVDPDEGDDSNDGSEEEPLLTFQEALNRLPHIIKHPTRIYLADGEYTHDPTTINSGVHMVTHRNDLADVEEPFLILGNPVDPENVRLSETAWTNLAIEGYAPHRTRIEGIQFDGKLQNYNGKMTVNDCRFTGQLVNSFSNAVDGYAGFMVVRNCWFGGDVDTAFFANQNHRIYATNCTGNVERIYRTAVMGEVDYADSNEINGQLP